jgi:4'-phosphopantetheinyl transferase
MPQPLSIWTPCLSIADVGSPSPGEVHLWRVGVADMPDDEASLAETLSRGERHRAGRFAFPHLSRRRLAGRMALRYLLGAYLRTASRDLSFGTRVRGKPFVKSGDGSPSALEFNISDAGDYVMIAVGRSRPLGVDIEAIRPIQEADEIVSRNFSAQEQAAYQHLPASKKQLGFFTAWTSKEAYAKAVGLGLYLPLETFSVTLDPDQPARLLEVDGSPAKAAEWRLMQIAAPEGHVGALVAKGPVEAVRHWSWPAPRPGRQHAEARSAANDADQTTVAGRRFLLGRKRPFGQPPRHPPSSEFARNSRQQIGAHVLKEVVIPWKPEQLEADRRQSSPAFKFMHQRFGIALTAEHRERAGQSRSGKRLVGVVKSKIGAQHRHEQRHQIRLSQHGLAGTAEFAQALDEAAVIQRIGGRTTGFHAGCTTGRYEQMRRRATVGCSDVARGFIGNCGPHAMAKKCERTVKIGNERLRKRRDQGRHVGNRRLPQPRPPSRQFNRKDPDFGGKMVGPISINLAVAPGKRKAE